MSPRWSPAVHGVSLRKGERLWRISHIRGFAAAKIRLLLRLRQPKIRVIFPSSKLLRMGRDKTIPSPLETAEEMLLDPHTLCRPVVCGSFQTCFFRGTILCGPRRKCSIAISFTTSFRNYLKIFWMYIKTFGTRWMQISLTECVKQGSLTGCRVMDR